MQRAPGALFVVLEGGDGAGKSTQAALLAGHLQEHGRDVVRTREPGGTPIGEKLRSLVLDHGHGEVDARTEALMFAAARAAHVEQLIVPALARGATVVCDRYIDSSVAYQGTGRGLGTDEVLALNRWATGGLRPDLTILLDVDPQAGRHRRTAGAAAEDRLESEPDDFHARIRQAFLDRATHDDGAYLVLDASLGVDELAGRIAAAVDGIGQAAGSAP
ncbi:dTMP kinase [Arthrobacter sp. JSM 101049]|uniref:dTMP kinase n=1 Tax=Arthrobacter sp. JSM 101049 TaxID=929097 RepID=UPI00356828D4